MRDSVNCIGEWWRDYTDVTDEWALYDYSKCLLFIMTSIIAISSGSANLQRLRVSGIEMFRGDGIFLRMGIQRVYDLCMNLLFVSTATNLLLFLSICTNNLCNGINEFFVSSNFCHFVKWKSWMVVLYNRARSLVLYHETMNFEESVYLVIIVISSSVPECYLSLSTIQW